MRALLPVAAGAAGWARGAAPPNATAAWPPPARREWAAVVAEIDGDGAVGSCVVTVGDAAGVLLEHQKGTTTPDTRMGIASATKWVSGVAIMAAVADGALGLDDPAGRHLEWWSRDPADPRSRVTLRHLLGFTSGFSGGFPLLGCGGAAELRDCARAIHDARAGAVGEPGAAFEYNELHLQLAGAVAEAAAGTPFVELARRHVFAPAGMHATAYGSATNPRLGAGITTTPADYHAFLRGYFTHALLPAGTRAEMERDQYPSAARSAWDDGWHYGLANWYECLSGTWGAECAALDTHSSAGALGFRPIVDRRLDYYYQIGHLGSSAATLALHRRLKPLVDAAVVASRRG